MTPEPTATMPRKMRKRIFEDRMSACAVCGKAFLKRRSWGQFCGDDCRKAYHKNVRTSGVDLSIRKDIAEIKAMLGILIERAGTK